MDISVVIITKNEEKMIIDCLRSVIGWVEEIILIDSNSIDKTLEIAKETCKENNQNLKVFNEKFSNFSEQRWFGAQKALNKWILYLDADERITSELKEEIVNTINSKTLFSAYYIYRENYYFGKKWSKKDKIQRLFQKDKLKGWQGEVHETPVLKGEYGVLMNSLLHYTHRDLYSMINKTNEWSEVEANLLIKINHPKMSVLRFIKIIMIGFFRSFIKEEGWKNGPEGLIESCYQGFSLFVTYAKLYEKQINKLS